MLGKLMSALNVPDTFEYTPGDLKGYEETEVIDYENSVIGYRRPQIQIGVPFRRRLSLAYKVFMGRADVLTWDIDKR